jgi:hypothetical protein
MTSFETSFASLFENGAHDAPVIERVEIPLIQRDFAQGRKIAAVTTIRENFLDVLHEAANGGEPVGLDFVYGEVDNGTLEPLDGQQRLTTLFLLHWYLATRTGRHAQDHRWARFSYATRPSARLFCERLAACDLPPSVKEPSSWITDQPWYLHVWGNDPTIQSMLVVLDAIAQRFRGDDTESAWLRLTDPEQPAVSFHLLPIEDMGSAEDLYIKMNSRGKPLTEFETFKARFQKILDGSDRADEFAHKVDGVWADVLWPLHGGDNIVDDEFLNYMHFIIEMCEWRENDLAARSLSLLDRAERALVTGDGATRSLDFFFDAFDTWVAEDTEAAFDEFFESAPTPTASPETDLVLFALEGSTDVNLFEACCRDFETARFTNPRKFLLYAVLLHRIHGTDDFPRRLRVLRNLVEASENEIRADRMPRLVADVYRIIVDGSLEDVEAMNQAQRDDEIDKRDFLSQHSDLLDAVLRLEDHEILRGSLMAFELDHNVFRHRAAAFRDVFSEPDRFHLLSGALLAVGDYHRRIGSTYRFGPPEQSIRWRELLTGTTRANLEATRATLGSLLDHVAGSDLPTSDRLEQIRQEFLTAQEAASLFDWRYYLVKYDAMREGKSGIYASAEDEFGFSLCMLNMRQMNSFYRDPFLLAVARRSNAQNSVTGGVDGGRDGPWFTGYSSTPRWMRLKASDTRIRCTTEGFLIEPPDDDQFTTSFAGVCAQHNTVQTGDGLHLLEVPYELEAERRFDTHDRVAMGADLLADLIKAGL